MHACNTAFFKATCSPSSQSLCGAYQSLWGDRVHGLLVQHHYHKGDGQKVGQVHHQCHREGRSSSRYSRDLCQGWCVWETIVQTLSLSSFLYSLPGPHPDLCTTAEAVWISYTNEYGKRMKLGVNPYGAYKIELFNGKQDITPEKPYTLDVVSCTHGTDYTDWSCEIELPWEFLPPSVSGTEHLLIATTLCRSLMCLIIFQVSSYQMVHNHKPLSHADSTVEASDYELVGQTCPGLRHGDKKIDWEGCDIDPREITLKDNNEYSHIWRYVLLKTC